MNSLPHSHAFSATLAIIALIVSAPASAAQTLRDGAYGLPPGALESGKLPPGWVPLFEDPDVDPTEPIPFCEEPENLDSNFEDLPWPGGIVPFEFDANVSSLNQIRTISAMVVIQSLADVSFVGRTGEAGFLHIQDDTVNQSSTIGFGGGQTTIRMTSWGTEAVIVHELLHALGFRHEQQRPDRATFVQIMLGNVQAGAAGNFSLAPTALTAGPYDFGSVMHYGACAFSICCPAGTVCGCPAGCETILPQPAFAAFQSTMGQRVAMSPLDVHGLRSLYPQSNWRFVDATNSVAGDGTGTDPWQSLASARTQAPAGARVFIMPAIYSAQGVWDEPMTLEAPVGGVFAQ